MSGEESSLPPEARTETKPYWEILDAETVAGLKELWYRDRPLEIDEAILFYPSAGGEVSPLLSAHMDLFTAFLYKEVAETGGGKGLSATGVALEKNDGMIVFATDSRRNRLGLLRARNRVIEDVNRAIGNLGIVENKIPTPP